MVRIGTNANILQHNRLNTNCFIFSKTYKVNKKNRMNISEGPIEIFETEIIFRNGVSRQHKQILLTPYLGCFDACID